LIWFPPAGEDPQAALQAAGAEAVAAGFYVPRGKPSSAGGFELDIACPTLDPPAARVPRCDVRALGAFLPAAGVVFERERLVEENRGSVQWRPGGDRREPCSESERLDRCQNRAMSLIKGADPTHERFHFTSDGDGVQYEL